MAEIGELTEKLVAQGAVVEDMKRENAEAEKHNTRTLKRSWLTCCCSGSATYTGSEAQDNSGDTESPAGGGLNA